MSNVRSTNLLSSTASLNTACVCDARSGRIIVLLAFYEGMLDLLLYVTVPRKACWLFPGHSCFLKLPCLQGCQIGTLR